MENEDIRFENVVKFDNKLQKYVLSKYYELWCCCMDEEVMLGFIQRMEEDILAQIDRKKCEGVDALNEY